MHPIRTINDMMADGGRYASTIAMRGLGTMMALDVAVPLVAYYLARLVHIGMTASLFIATIAAGVRMVWLIRKNGELDGFSVFMLVVFAGGLGLSLVTGDPRFMLAKGAAATIAGGLVMIGSAVVKHPITFMVGKRLAGKDARARGELERGWAQCRNFRIGFYVMSCVWGVGLILESILRLWLIYTVNLDVAVASTTGITVVTFLILVAWQIWFVQRSRTLARRAGYLTNDNVLRVDAPEAATAEAAFLE
ncbi:VC0807 family protein [Branchiibius cervicis]|uniref:VC0807 family protein n=1 Tax=Branchiibius cervicis TaxID=908252 RepID=A0ABW2AYN3_9MICO